MFHSGMGPLAPLVLSDARTLFSSVSQSELVWLKGRLDFTVLPETFPLIAAFSRFSSVFTTMFASSCTFCCFVHKNASLKPQKKPAKKNKAHLNRAADVWFHYHTPFFTYVCVLSVHPQTHKRCTFHPRRSRRCRIKMADRGISVRFLLSFSASAIASRR